MTALPYFCPYGIHLVTVYVTPSSTLVSFTRRMRLPSPLNSASATGIMATLGLALRIAVASSLLRLTRQAR